MKTRFALSALIAATFTSGYCELDPVATAHSTLYEAPQEAHLVKEWTRLEASSLYDLATIFRQSQDTLDTFFLNIESNCYKFLDEYQQSTDIYDQKRHLIESLDISKEDQAQLTTRATAELIFNSLCLLSVRMYPLSFQEGNWAEQFKELADLHNEATLDTYNKTLASIREAAFSQLISLLDSTADTAIPTEILDSWVYLVSEVPFLYTPKLLEGEQEFAPVREAVIELLKQTIGDKDSFSLEQDL